MNKEQLIDKLEDLYLNIKNFFKNVFNFRKELLEFRSYDYTLNLKLFKRSLIITRNNMRKYSYEVDEHKNNKLKIMDEVIFLIDYHLNSKCFDEVKGKLDLSNISIAKEFDGEKYNRYKAKELDLEEQRFDELWEAIKNNIAGWWY